MVDTSPSRPGQINGAGAADALWLKVYSGEVLSSFAKRIVIAPKVRKRSISRAKSAQFMAVGRALTSYHSIGDNVLDPANANLNLFKQNEQVITLDGELLSATFVSDIEELKSHWDVRSEYSTEQGRAMAVELDSRLLRLLVLTGRNTTPNITGQEAGEVIMDVDFETNGASAVATAFSVAQKFDEKHVPEEDRYLAMAPLSYYSIVQDKSLINRDFGGGPNGVFHDGVVLRAAGIQLVKTTLMPTTNFVANAGEANSTTGDFTDTVAVAWHRSAVASLQLRGLRMESEYKIEYRGDILVASMAMGHGSLRPEAAIEIDRA